MLVMLYSFTFKMCLKTNHILKTFKTCLKCVDHARKPQKGETLPKTSERLIAKDNLIKCQV